MAIFRQNTIYVHQFPMVTTGGAPATGVNASLVVKLGKNGAAGVTAAGTTAEVDATNLKGVYSLTFATTDVNTLGSLELVATATGCNQLTESHQVQGQLFTDLQLTGGGNAIAAGTLRQNIALNAFPFLMTSSGLPKTGLTVAAQRSINGGGFAPCANVPTEISNGIYVINLAAADLNGATVTLRFTASGADDNDIFLVLQP